MTNTPITRTKLKQQNALSRQEQVKGELEDARRLELEQIARLRAQRLAKEAAEAKVDSADQDSDATPETSLGEWPWDYPQAHRR